MQNKISSKLVNKYGLSLVLKKVTIFVVQCFC